MPPLEIIGLFAVACAAGLMNAVAGGGTVLTFPVLLFFGTPAIIANATSTVALVIGTAGSIYGFRRQIVRVKSWLQRFVLASALGGWLGSYLLTRTSETFFSALVPYLILFATLLFFANGAFRSFAGLNGAEPPRRHALWGAILFQFAVAVYGGYFGAGIGILMLATFGIMGLRDIHQMNALKNVLGSLINVVASLWFIASGLVHWPKALVMMSGALVGYFLGAHYSQRISQQIMRRLIAGIGFGIALLMFYKQLSR